MKGRIQIYTGNGKGKTTAALGLALRAVGAGLRVFLAQFAKSRQTSELQSIAMLGSGIEVQRFGKNSFIRGTPTDEDKSMAHQGLSACATAVARGSYDVVIMDEVITALDLNLLKVEEIEQILQSRPEHVEIIMTGRNAPKELIEKADLVTEMVEIKHYYAVGVEARPGIEY